MKYTKLVLLLMVLLLAIVGCKKEETPRYNYTNYVEEPVKKERNKLFKKSTKIDNEVIKEPDSSFGNSYWFVVWEVKGTNTKVNTFITQPHLGFSMKEFKENHGDDIFLINLVEVSYHTYNIN